MLRAFDHICMEKARYKFLIIIILIINDFSSLKAKTHDATNRWDKSPRQVAATNRLV